MTTRHAQGDNTAIINAKLYVPVVPLSAEDDNKLLQQVKTGFKKKTIKWNNYRS